jgi:hypothetical protein
MLEMLQHGLSNRNPFVRKGCTLALQAPKRLAKLGTNPSDYALRPPVLANSVPKSGTHLLDQIVAALPHGRNYGAFLSSMTSSYRFRRRTFESEQAFIRDIVPAEIVRAHLFFNDDHAVALRSLNACHFFITRDLRDVAISEAHYLRNLNRWHRLHRYFRQTPSVEDAISMAIEGLPHLAPKIDFPNIRQRFERYAGWITHPEVFAVRFEDLVSDRRDEVLQGMASFYAAHTTAPIDVELLVSNMRDSIDPKRSHTYRSGQSGGWRKQFTPEHHKLFEKIAGNLLQNDKMTVNAS